MHIKGGEKLSIANKELAFPPRSSLKPGAGSPPGDIMGDTMEDEEREHQMTKFEIDNCRKNIEFYRLQIENMEEKILELEKLKRQYEYY